MKKVSYYNELRDENGYVYSIDNLRIEFFLDKSFEKIFLSYMSFILRTDIYYQENFKHHKYKHLWTIRYSDYASMTIGYCFNGNDFHSDSYKGFIDVNPNKTGNHEQFWIDFNKLKSFCKFFNVARCDIAIDLPIKREYLLLTKDKRKYEQISYSYKNKTEYLGTRSRIGFTKIYNKTMESKLDYDLTRVEITCLLSKESFNQYYPKIFDMSQNTKLSRELDSLNDTERAIINMLSILNNNGDDSALIIFNSMGRVMKNKLKKFIASEHSQIIYSEKTLTKLIDNAQHLYLKDA